MRGEMDDDVDVRVLDAVDPAPERRVVTGEVLQEIAELVGPGVLALVDPVHLVTVGLESEREVRADLA
jgi:hypothetical protein